MLVLDSYEQPGMFLPSVHQFIACVLANLPSESFICWLCGRWPVNSFTILRALWSFGLLHLLPVLPHLPVSITSTVKPRSHWLGDYSRRFRRKRRLSPRTAMELPFSATIVTSVDCGRGFRHNSYTFYVRIDPKAATMFMVNKILYPLKQAERCNGRY